MPACRRRVGSVMLAALVFVAGAALAAGAVAARGAASGDAARWERERTLARQAAASGVLAVLAEFSRQGEALRTGADPVLPAEITLWEEESGRAVARFVRASAEWGAAGGEGLAVAEAGLWNVNADGTGRGADAGAAELVRNPADGGDAGDEAVARALTAWSRDPDVRVADDGPRARDEQGRGRGEIAAELVQRGVPWGEMDAVLDAVAAVGGAGEGGGASGVTGRVDLSHASAAVLARVPGLDEAAAERMVAARERLDRSELSSLTWPVRHAGVSAEAFVAGVERWTTRSAQWRVVIETGFDVGFEVGFEVGGEAGAARGLDAAGETRGALERRTVLMVVVDVSGEAARVVALCDQTLGGTELGAASGAVAEDSEEEGAAERAGEVERSAAPVVVVPEEREVTASAGRGVRPARFDAGGGASGEARP